MAAGRGSVGAVHRRERGCAMRGTSILGPQERIGADVTKASDSGPICGSHKNFHRSGFCTAEQIVVYQ